MATDNNKEPRKPRRPLREVWPAWREGLFIVGSLLVSAAVAGVTGWGSWGHIVHIGHSVGEPSADWLPVAIDGMMFNGTILVAVDRFRRRVARPWAVVSLWLGSVLTLAFNVASAWERGLWAMLIAVTYSVALLCTVEAVFHPSQTTIEEAMHRRAERRAAKAKAQGENAPVPVVPTIVPTVAPIVTAVEPEPAAPEVVTTTPEPAPTPVKATPTRKPRGPRKPRANGYPRSGDIAAQVEAAIEELTEQRASAESVDSPMVPEVAV
jgi:hypothetical protein